MDVCVCERLVMVVAVRGRRKECWSLNDWENKQYEPFLPLSSFALSNGEQLTVLYNVKYGIRAQAEGHFWSFPLWKGRRPPLPEYPRNIGSPRCEDGRQLIELVKWITRAGPGNGSPYLWLRCSLGITYVFTWSEALSNISHYHQQRASVDPERNRWGKEGLRVWLWEVCAAGDSALGSCLVTSVVFDALRLHGL